MSSSQNSDNTTNVAVSSENASETVVQTPSSSTTQSSSERIAEAKAAVTASLTAVGSSIDADLQARARDMHANAASIAKQQIDFDRKTATSAKAATKLQKDLDANTRKLNEFGDLQNWAEMLERDIMVLEEVVRLKEGRPDEGETNASGTNAPLERT